VPIRIEKLGERLDTKTIALVIVFAALTIALEPVRIPIPIWPGQYYRLWELPVIIALFLFGFKVGFAVAVLDAISYIWLFPDLSGPLGPPWRLVVMLSVFLGLYLATRVTNSDIAKKESGWRKPVLYFTAFAIITRTAIMPFVDYGVYRFLLPFVIGRIIPDAYILGLMPAIVFFNITVPLYIVPIAYGVAKTVSRNLKIGSMFQSSNT
jgi:riboflavin transporter FmnP